MSQELAEAAMGAIKELSNCGHFDIILSFPSIRGKTTVELIHIFRMLRYNKNLANTNYDYKPRVDSIIKICKDIVKDLIDIRDQNQ